ncbi:MAG: hypothetical protein ACRCVI_02250 [Mycoplasmoidaceae bacterium]
MRSEYKGDLVEGVNGGDGIIVPLFGCWWNGFTVLGFFNKNIWNYHLGINLY